MSEASKFKDKEIKEITFSESELKDKINIRFGSIDNGIDFAKNVLNIEFYFNNSKEFSFDMNAEQIAYSNVKYRNSFHVFTYGANNIRLVLKSITIDFNSLVVEAV